MFQQARDLIFKARALDPESYYPIDVLAWTSQNLLESGVFTSNERAEVEIDVLHVFETAEVEDFAPVQQIRFNERRMKWGQLLEKEDLSEESFNALVSLKSCAGYFLKALHIADDISSSDALSKWQIDRCKRAADYLESNRRLIAGDGRCLYLLLRLWWIANSGKKLFARERQALPFDNEKWQYCFALLSQLISAGELNDTPTNRFLHALAAFHLGELNASFDGFKELERDFDIRGRRRIVRSHLASTPTGQPRPFNGTVKWASDDGRKGALYVEELRREIRFLPLDFQRPNIRTGESVSLFHIAFNFIGPIADPPEMYVTD